MKATRGDSRPTTGRRARVRIDGRPCGRPCGWLVELVGGGSRFTYDAAWLASPEAVPVSLTLPLARGVYESPTLLPFFANLLPEGWLLELTTRRLKVSRDDAFGLVLATCADCMGAVEVVSTT